jgi:hypothetical protein
MEKNGNILLLNSSNMGGGEVIIIRILKFLTKLQGQISVFRYWQ